MHGIDTLERLLARTWPGLEQDHLGEWLLRAGHGWTGRANSALAVGDPGLSREEALDRVAAWYAARGLPPRVHVPLPLSGSDAAGEALLAACAALGWAAGPWTWVMTRDVGAGPADRPGPAASGLELEWDDAPGDDWVSLVRGGSLPEHGRAILAAAPAWYLTVRVDGEPVACGRAAPVEGWVVLSAIEVAPGHRRGGLGALTTEALTARGAAAGASRVALQVEVANKGAVALYRKLGYAEHHRYTYCAG
ncbi:GNAT family N-acetyltransferase [Propioniciclava sp. MC1683]|uniref:GNAT family N-acetyltransferase n=1 Tax=Propioniciclava sp. MC1683 TaxID=2760309 RepID=UPI0016007879|nr:GNAT family N-acetyltransferase [Propioniciclava sp. MC1683]MBB1500262.1 GNAT family N-acetyltransferase [Propioniciclava sp. MC1683]